MDGQPGNRQQLRIDAVIPVPGEGEPPTPEYRAPEGDTDGAANREIARQTATLLAELGRRVGQVEVLAGQFPTHEANTRGLLDTFDERLRAIAEELRGRADGLERTFLGHRHDAPAPPALPEIVDNPVQELDQALGDAVGTPEAPHAEAQVQEPKALAKIKPGATIYHSRLHRGR